MNDIIWLSHGGPGSGRYPKGSGENPRGAIRSANKLRRKNARLLDKWLHKRAAVYRTAKRFAKLEKKVDNNTARGDYVNKANRLNEKAIKNTSEMKNIEKEIAFNTKEHKKIESFITKKMNTPLKEVRRDTVLHPAAIPLLAVGIPPRTVTYYKVKKI